MQRVALGCCLVAIILAHAGVEAQTVKPAAMTAEEIEAQLKSAPKFTGEIAVNGKRLGAIDSEKAQPYPWRSLNPSEARPTAWVDVTTAPTVAITLSRELPNAVTLTNVRGGQSEGTVMILQRRADAKAIVYDVQFAHSNSPKEPLEPGDYEFGTMKGTLAFFFRCGFTIEQKP